jgi:hypothetical protein
LEQCILISGSIPTPSVGVLFSAAVPLAVYGEVCPQGRPALIPIGRPQSSLPILPANRIASPDAPLPKERVEAATVPARSPRQISPQAARFIERVLVPALVKRYIAKLSSMGEQGGLTG